MLKIPRKPWYKYRNALKCAVDRDPVISFGSLSHTKVYSGAFRENCSNRGRSYVGCFAIRSLFWRKTAKWQRAVINNQWSCTSFLFRLIIIPDFISLFLTSLRVQSDGAWQQKCNLSIYKDVSVETSSVGFLLAQGRWSPLEGSVSPHKRWCICIQAKQPWPLYAWSLGPK